MNARKEIKSRHFDGEGMELYTDVYDGIIMYAIGKTDRNGKDIFEGDKIKIHVPYKHNEKSVNNAVYTGIVYYSPVLAQYRFSRTIRIKPLGV